MWAHVGDIETTSWPADNSCARERCKEEFVVGHAEWEVAARMSTVEFPGKLPDTAKNDFPCQV